MLHIHLWCSLPLAEEKMFAELWEKDHHSKCKKEEMEAAMQLERNREMLRVSTSKSTL